MLKLSIAGMLIGVVTGLLFLFVGIVLSKHAPSFRKRKARKIYWITAIVASTLIAVFCGVQMGYYIQNGNYSDRDCNYASCDAPCVVKFHCSISGNDYFCADHHAFAVNQYHAFTSHTFHEDSSTTNTTWTPSGNASVNCRTCRSSYRANHPMGEFIKTHGGQCMDCYSKE